MTSPPKPEGLSLVERNLYIVGLGYTTTPLDVPTYL